MATTNQLKTLHTAAIDAANGYREALKEAEGKGMTPLFSEMVAMHDAHATQLASLLTEAGIEPASGGSFMSIVHQPSWTCARCSPVSTPACCQG